LGGLTKNDFDIKYSQVSSSLKNKKGGEKMASLMKFVLLAIAMFIPLMALGEAKRWQKFISVAIFAAVGTFIGLVVIGMLMPPLWLAAIIFCGSLIWSMYVSMDNAEPPKGLLSEEDTSHFSNSTPKSGKDEVDWNARCSSCHLGMGCRGPNNGACELYP
jgi:hypothetical protein